jgi:signal transduction histidine kinase
MSRQFEQKVKELSTVRQIGDALSHPLDREKVCVAILEAVVEGMGAETGVLILFDPSKRISMGKSVSSPGNPMEDCPFNPTQEMIEWVMKERNPLLLQNLSHTPGFSFKDGPDSGSAMVLPLISRAIGIGVVTLGHSDKDAFRPEKVPAGHIVASQAAIGLENAKLLHELIEMNQSLEGKILERTRSLQKTNRRLVEMQDQLVQAEKMKIIGQFTAGVGHNLRTPLSVILSSADLLKVHGDGNGKVTGYADKIARQGARMAEIIEDLMAKCRKATLRETEKLNINDVLRSELNFLEANLEFKHNVRKEIDFDNDLPQIKGLYTDFSQTFVNLINNAVDAMDGREDKLLRIRTKYDRAHIYVDVEDNGCGIRDEDKEKIFDFSFTTKTGQSEEGGSSGMGIGLFNSQHLMSKYSAQILVNTRPGETVFTVQIPLQP